LLINRFAVLNVLLAPVNVFVPENVSFPESVKLPESVAPPLIVPLTVPPEYVLFVSV
jgi:hypothetical protein